MLTPKYFSCFGTTPRTLCDFCKLSSSFVLVTGFLTTPARWHKHLPPDWSISRVHLFCRMCESFATNPLLIGSNSSEDEISSLFYHLDQSSCPIPPVRVRDHQGFVKKLSTFSSVTCTEDGRLAFKRIPKRIYFACLNSKHRFYSVRSNYYHFLIHRDDCNYC